MTSTPLRPFVFRWTDSIEHDETLSRTARHCALALAREMDVDGRHCFPSKATLALRMNVCERTVARMLNELKEAGWLAWRQRPQRGSVRLNSNTYIPMIPEGREVDSRTHDNQYVTMSENSTGEDFLQSLTYSDILEERTLVVDATCVWIRNTFGLDSTETDGYLKLVDAVSNTYDRHGRDGLLRLCTFLDEQGPDSLTTAQSPLRVLSHRVRRINYRMPVIDPTLPFD